jgi:hypothetical protein
MWVGKGKTIDIEGNIVFSMMVASRVVFFLLVVVDWW